MGEGPGAAAGEQPMINPTEYLPKSYRTRVSTYWWLERWVYLKFILREASSVFVAWTVVVTLLQIRALARGPADYAEFQNWLGSPLLLALNAVSLIFVIFHAVTWFNLAPKAMAIRMRGKRLPNLAISAPNYVAWVVISAAVAWILLRG
jgi:fumarate reductase subunit C